MHPEKKSKEIIGIYVITLKEPICAFWEAQKRQKKVNVFLFFFLNKILLTSGEENAYSDLKTYLIQNKMNFKVYTRTYF